MILHSGCGPVSWRTWWSVQSGWGVRSAMTLYCPSPEWTSPSTCPAPAAGPSTHKHQRHCGGQKGLLYYILELIRTLYLYYLLELIRTLYLYYTLELIHTLYLYYTLELIGTLYLYYMLELIGTLYLYYMLELIGTLYLPQGFPWIGIGVLHRNNTLQCSLIISLSDSHITLQTVS
ncbi:UNVERIFIED_CONTAM: hypothetical protein FKN15_004484 [Acipenser sinensis]